MRYDFQLELCIRHSANLAHLKIEIHRLATTSPPTDSFASASQENMSADMSPVPRRQVSTHKTVYRKNSWCVHL